MSLRRPQLPGPRGTRRLIVCGIAAAMVAVPGAASAATPSGIPTQAELEAQFNSLLAQLGITEKCSTSVEADIEAIADDLLGGLGDLPTETSSSSSASSSSSLPSLPISVPGASSSTSASSSPDTDAGTEDQDEAADQVNAALESGSASLTDADPSDLTDFFDGLTGALGDILDPATAEQLAADVQQLLTDLQACLPTAAPTTTDTSETTAAETTEAADETTAEATTEDAEYLGYAPTGGDGSDGDGSPLGLLGAGTVLLAGGGLATRSVLRSRASR